MGIHYIGVPLCGKRGDREIEHLGAYGFGVYGSSSQNPKRIPVHLLKKGGCSGMDHSCAPLGTS